MHQSHRNSEEDQIVLKNLDLGSRIYGHGIRLLNQSNYWSICCVSLVGLTIRLLGLHVKNFPVALWAEGMACLVYVINQVPLSTSYITCFFFFLNAQMLGKESSVNTSKFLIPFAMFMH